MKKTAVMSSAVILLAVAAGVGAETMQTRGIGRAPAGSPYNGLSMDQVQQSYGEPQERMVPVGDPPITRWVYPDYTVYFEYSLVLTSVGNR